MLQPEPRRLLIFGAGGFGREVLQIVRDIEAHRPGSWRPVGFIVDPPYAASTSGAELPVFFDDMALRRDAGLHLVIAVGSPAERRAIAARLSWLPDERCATLIHPGAYTGRLAGVGAGSVICAGAILTTDIRIGRHVQVHAGATIGHDTKIDDLVSVYPGAIVAGHVRLRTGAELGSGCVVLPKLEVGAWSIVGAGSVVISPLAPNVTAVGNPARVVEVRPDGWQGAPGATVDRALP